MTISLFRHSRPLLAALGFALLLAACDGSSPTASVDGDASEQDLSLRDDGTGALGIDDPETQDPTIAPGEPHPLPQSLTSIEDLVA